MEKISYERLFNLGSYDHEKFLVTKEVEEEDRLSCFKELHNELIKFEKELSVYRGDRRKVEEYHVNDPIWQEELSFLHKRIQAFEEEHKPVKKDCKCFYCRHPDFYQNQEYDLV